MSDLKVKCLTGEFDECVCLSGNVKCWGGFSDKPCKFLYACVQQNESVLKKSEFKNLLRKIRRIGFFKT